MSKRYPQRFLADDLGDGSNGFDGGGTGGKNLRPVLNAQSANKKSTRRSRILAYPNP